jgi:hypothetical protein
LTAKVEAARDTAPEGADVEAIAGVAWVAYKSGRQAVDVWREVLADG